jgi:predicted  nucleic acid-binding Zn-ribbon protein
VKKDMMNLEQDLVRLKEDIRELGIQKAAMANQPLRNEQEIRDMKPGGEFLRKRAITSGNGRSERLRLWRNCKRSFGR